MVKVEVEDINDNAPVFFPNQYNVTLQKSVSVGQQVGVIVIFKIVNTIFSDNIQDHSHL